MSTLSELRETVGISVGAMSRLARRPRTVIESYEANADAMIRKDPDSAREAARLQRIYEGMAVMLKAANS